MSKPKIGNQDSALQRIHSFIERWRSYIGAEPETIVLFAEDYDSIDFSKQPQCLRPYKFVRGPSIAEYQAAARASPEAGR